MTRRPSRSPPARAPRVAALWACACVASCVDDERGLVGVTDAGRFVRYDAWATLNPQRCVDRTGGVIAGCPCLAGEEVDCYTGPLLTRRVGACRDGVMRCQRVSAQELGVFDGTTCERQVLPVRELCNGVDDDCDGRTDEGCPVMDAGPVDVNRVDVPRWDVLDGCVPRTCGPLCGTPPDGCGRTLTCRPCVSTCASTPAVLADGPTLMGADLVVPWRGYVHMYVQPTRPGDERVLGRVPTATGFTPVGLFPHIERPVFEGDVVVYEPGPGRIGMRRTDGTGPIYEFPTAVFDGSAPTGPRGIAVDGAAVYTVGRYDESTRLGLFRLGRSDGSARRLAPLSDDDDWALFASDATHFYVRATLPPRAGDARGVLTVARVPRAGGTPETVFGTPSPAASPTDRVDLFGIDGTHAYGFRTDDLADADPGNDVFVLFRVARAGGAVTELWRETPSTVSPAWPPRLVGARIVYSTGHTPVARDSGVWVIPAAGGAPTRLLSSVSGEFFRAFGVENNCVFAGSVTINAGSAPVTRVHAVSLP